VYGRALATNELRSIYLAGSAGKCSSVFAPSILSQPSSQTIQAGQTATFNVVAAGTAPLRYQWNLEGRTISGATSSSLLIPNAQARDAGRYSVNVANNLSSVTSSNALLTIIFSPANIRVPSITAVSGDSIIIPVILNANGNENAMGFSLNFSTNTLTYAGVRLGSNAPNAMLMVNTNQLTAGRLGLALALPSGVTFAPGQTECVQMTFTAKFSTNQTITSIGFGDVPTQRQLSDAQANALQATYSSGTIMLTSSQLEADVTPRPNGDKAVTITDWVQVGRYVARLDSPTNSSEFQRADCAPRETSGNGVLSIADWVQSGRYTAGLDPFALLGGPTGPSSLGAGSTGLRTLPTKKSLVRKITVESAPSQGQNGNVAVWLESQGDENAVGFSVAFDAAALNFTGAEIGEGASGTTYNLNTAEAKQGRVAFAAALPTGASFAVGKQQLLKLKFTAVTSSPSPYAITFEDQPVTREITDANATDLAAQFVSGSVLVGNLPSLSISRSPEGIVISWPEGETNVGLYQAVGDSPSGATWQAVPGNPVLMNGRRTITVPLSDTMKLYRLQQ
jgi:hypothetical protein